MRAYLHNHTHLTSPDPEKTLEFYTQVMGAEITQVREVSGRRLVDIDLGGVPVRLSSSTGADEAWQGLQYGLHHIGLSVSNLEEFTADLKSKGVEFIVEPAQTGGRVAFFKGPNNVLFEIIEVKED